MKILLFEYINGGGMSQAEHLPDDLCAQGRQMLTALAADFSALAGAELFSMHDARLPPLPNCNSTVVTRQDNALDILFNLLKEVDFLLAIAPEEEGMLEAVCRLSAGQKAVALNSSVAAVQLCASKYKTSRRLQQAHIAVVPSYRHDELRLPASRSSLYAIKPDDSAGAQGLRRVPAAELINAGDNEVIQPWLEGQVGSLSIVCCSGQAYVLGINKQVYELHNDTWRLRSCIVNGFTPFLVEEFSTLAQAIVHAIPGLAGYIGVDFIHHHGVTTVLEINPRLSLSYVGLRESLQCNPAVLLLAAHDQPPPFDTNRLRHAGAVPLELA